MARYAGTTEERLAEVELLAAEARKLLLGALVLAEEAWGEELKLTSDGLEVMGEVRDAEETFADPDIDDRLERVTETIEVVRVRSEALFRLAGHFSEMKKKQT